MKLKTKMILLISTVVVISVIPLSLIVIWRGQQIVTERTFQICRNLSKNIAAAATEELLVDTTYDGTRSVVARLAGSDIDGLVDAFVINADGKFVADMHDDRLNSFTGENDRESFSGINELTMLELPASESRYNHDILRFVYPIFIQYKGHRLPVGSAVFDFNKNAIYAPVINIRTTIILYTAIVLGIGIVIAVLTAIYITRPILSLSEGATVIGEGNLSYRIDVESGDEIGQLAGAFNQMTARIQDFTNNLEEKVADRTRELNKSLTRVQELKQQQDGDYFLTSLLTRPLQSNKNRSNNIVSEFIIEQKKKFSFKKWDSEIGGDICITDTIRLDGKNFTVFLNADAMGKSIQGAGGVLVLGAAFQATLIQARLGRAQNRYPELWLRDVYHDLQNMFVSFDGSMYLSLVLGLVDETSGLMYFINAEHPFTVLYRQGKASFLEEELELRKLGIPGQEEMLSVRNFQLEPGDVIICGSDGRDDYLIVNDKGEEYINEDEFKFLRITEECKGNIKKIRDHITDRYEPIDDISMLKISFIEKDTTGLAQNTGDRSDSSRPIQESYRLIAEGDEEQALQVLEKFLEEAKGTPQVLKTLGRLYMNQERPDKAAECFAEYVRLEPNHNEYIFATAEASRLAELYDQAIDFGERLKLREPKNVPNLINLARSYQESGESRRAKEVIEKVFNYEKNNQEALELRKIILDTYSDSREQKQVTELMGLATIAYRSRQYRTALAHYERILDLEPKNLYAMNQAGNCNRLSGNDLKAIDLYSEVVKIDPDQYRTQNHLAVIYYNRGEYNQAFLHAQRALRARPDYSPALKNMKSIKEKL